MVVDFVGSPLENKESATPRLLSTYKKDKRSTVVEIKQ